MVYATLDTLDVTNKKVLLRADLNVPMQDGVVSDAERIVRLLATLRELMSKKAKTIILSHFGRPDGKALAKYSLRPIAAELTKHLQTPVGFAEDCRGPIAMSAIVKMQPGEVLVLENTRFHAGEEANDPAFAAEIAELGDVFVNDAFSAAHRAHASTEGIAHLLPSAAGRLMQAELDALEKALSHPVRPVAALVGGAKISTKIDLLNNLVRKVDLLVLGGGMANTFMAAQGLNLGKSLVEPNMLDVARHIMAEAAASGCKILLPRDVVIAVEFKAHAATMIVAADHVPADAMVLDLGPQAIAEINDALDECKTVLWNGPLGAFETPPFAEATIAVAKHVAVLTKAGKILSVAGGGDTVGALSMAGVLSSFSYISTAGGAFLEWVEGKALPGVTALQTKVK